MGSLDDDADFDYFQFQAEEGRHYEVAARFTGDSDKRALLYTSNGFAPADYYLDFWSAGERELRGVGGGRFWNRPRSHVQPKRGYWPVHRRGNVS